MPYTNLPNHAFWRLCREAEDFNLTSLFKPSFDIQPDTKIGTAGSCFAQHIGRYLKQADASFLDVEPAPSRVPVQLAKKYGYGIFSARFGNVYTTRQLLQLVRDARDGVLHKGTVWLKNGRFYDALRPGVEPRGLAERKLVHYARQAHLKAVKKMFEELDVFVFTLGLTETWTTPNNGLVYPTAPGTIAGSFSPRYHNFWNMQYPDVREDLEAIIAELREINPKLKFLFTVSPVPLTATASGQHILSATTYSKSTLRAAAADVAQAHDGVDYFPSYEIITGAPFAGQFFEDNLRSVREEGVDTVMYLFFASYPDLMKHAFDLPDLLDVSDDGSPEDDLVCEEALLDVFAAQ